jgi:stearoyl-CoA desaturase (delta-9 desaturase)
MTRLQRNANIGAVIVETGDESTNVLWLSIPSLGEACHHNHHAFPRAAVQGLPWWEIDISGMVIRAMTRVGFGLERGADNA